MTDVRPFVPPHASEPSPWQRAVAAEAAAAAAETLAAELSEATGAQVSAELAHVQLASQPPDSLSATDDAARALVAAAAGFDRPVPVNLAGAIEQAICSEIVSRLRSWRASALPTSPATGPACIATYNIACPAGSGQITASWPFQAVVQHALQSRSERPNLAWLAEALPVRLEAIIRGPAVALDWLAQMGPGDLLVLAEGAQASIELRAGSAPVARGTLGARRGQLAVRIHTTAPEVHQP